MGFLFCASGLEVGSTAAFSPCDEKAGLVDYLMSDEVMCVRQKSFRHELLLQEFLDR